MSNFENFVRANADMLLRTAYLLTGNKRDAEDLAQDTLEKVHRNWPRVSCADSPAAYARRMLVNTHLDGQRRPDIAAIPAVAVESWASAQDLQGALADRDLARQLLASLPPRQRTALVLRFYSELSNAELAVEMGISESSARGTVARGIESLRAQLHHQEAVQ